MAARELRVHVNGTGIAGLVPRRRERPHATVLADRALLRQQRGRPRSLHGDFEVVVEIRHTTLRGHVDLDRDGAAPDSRVEAGAVVSPTLFIRSRELNGVTD